MGRMDVSSMGWVRGVMTMPARHPPLPLAAGLGVGGVGGGRAGEELRRPEPLDGPLHGTQQKAEQGLGGVGGYG